MDHHGFAFWQTTKKGRLKSPGVLMRGAPVLSDEFIDAETSIEWDINKGLIQEFNLADHILGMQTDSPKCLILAPTMVGGEENVWFLHVLKRFISRNGKG